MVVEVVFFRGLVRGGRLALLRYARPEHAGGEGLVRLTHSCPPAGRSHAQRDAVWAVLRLDQRLRVMRETVVVVVVVLL